MGIPCCIDTFLATNFTSQMLGRGWSGLLVGGQTFRKRREAEREVERHAQLEEVYFGGFGVKAVSPRCTKGLAGERRHQALNLGATRGAFFKIGVENATYTGQQLETAS